MARRSRREQKKAAAKQHAARIVSVHERIRIDHVFCLFFLVRSAINRL